jgi:homoaconitate hydratase family protein
MHAIEKILAKHSGKKQVSAGEIITAKVDFAEINDLYLQTIASFYDMGGKRVWDNRKAAFVFDHYAPCPTVKTADNHKAMRTFAKENELTHHFDINCGVCHQIMPEAGVVFPGMILVATDSHTTTHGAFGALGTGCGATDMACILLEGQTWFRVPEIVEIRLEGATKEGVYPKDVILFVLGQMKADGAVYKAIDFTGSYVENLDVAGRMTVCNMAVEMGAKTAYMQPNEKVLEYIESRTDSPFEVEYTDPGYQYSDSYVFQVDQIEPQVACPHSVDNVCSISKIAEQRIPLDQGYIGSCTNGRTDDLREAARILKGKQIPEYRRLVIVPASKEVMLESMEAGYIQDLMNAGAVIGTPGCAACLGTHEGIVGPGEICITSTNRNFKGRMGSPQAKLYLASPATVAASILNGYITDPRPYLKSGEIHKDEK